MVLRRTGVPRSALYGATVLHVPSLHRAHSTAPRIVPLHDPGDRVIQPDRTVSIIGAIGTLIHLYGDTSQWRCHRARLGCSIRYALLSAGNTIHTNWIERSP